MQVLLVILALVMVVRAREEQYLNSLSLSLSLYIYIYIYKKIVLKSDTIYSSILLAYRCKQKFNLRDSHQEPKAGNILRLDVASECFV